MINVETLKKKVLDLAMRGKLVPQDANDEPASVLIEKIKAEKDELIKAKKIKKTKALPPIEPDEIPYQIPDGWEWVRLGCLGNVYSGGTPSKNISEYWDNKEIPWITPAQLGKIQNDIFMNEPFDFISTLGLKKSSAQLVPKGSIVYSSRAPIGHINIVNFDFSTNQGAKSLQPIIVNSKYIYFSLNASRTRIEKMGSGSTFKEISKTKFSNIILPLPPLAEQKRIVTKIEEIFAELDKIESASNEYDKCKELLNKRVLDLAMRGKLVPQDANDEPASVLIKKIKAEKDELIKAKKIKKTKALPPIESDEIPYQIPDSWEWVRLGEISKIVTKGTTPKGGNSAYLDSGINYYRAENVKGKLIKNQIKYIDKQVHLQQLKRSILEKNDLLITIAGTLGSTAIVQEEDLPGNINQAISIIRFVNSKFINEEFIQYSVMANICNLTIKKKTTSIPNLTLQLISELLIPLPPLAEQKRIVAKIEEIQSQLKEK